MVSGVDRVMARVLDALEEQGRAEDTIVICMEHQTGGDWPRECLPGSCREPYDSDPRNHSGRAHAH